MTSLEKIQKKIKSNDYTFDLVVPEKRFFELSKDFMWLMNECLSLRAALEKIQYGLSGDFYSKISPDEIAQIIELVLKERK